MPRSRRDANQALPERPATRRAVRLVVASQPHFWAIWTQHQAHLSLNLGMPKNANTAIWPDNANIERAPMPNPPCAQSYRWTRQSVNLGFILLSGASLCVAVAFLVSP